MCKQKYMYCEIFFFYLFSPDKQNRKVTIGRGRRQKSMMGKKYNKLSDILLYFSAILEVNLKWEVCVCSGHFCMCEGGNIIISFYRFCLNTNGGMHPSTFTLLIWGPFFLLVARTTSTWLQFRDKCCTFYFTAVFWHLNLNVCIVNIQRAYKICFVRN